MKQILHEEKTDKYTYTLTVDSDSYEAHFKFNRNLYNSEKFDLSEKLSDPTIYHGLEIRIGINKVVMTSRIQQKFDPVDTLTRYLREMQHFYPEQFPGLESFLDSLESINDETFHLRDLQSTPRIKNFDYINRVLEYIEDCANIRDLKRKGLNSEAEFLREKASRVLKIIQKKEEEIKEAKKLNLFK
jgi:hypothetical protein